VSVVPHFDVVIMGGGPAGATLGALLARQSALSVCILEKEVFPRDHIGESFAHPLIPVLEESGALEKVLASDCWVKKYGGIFNWDRAEPRVAFFDHANWANDGVHRWAMHVNRAEFDHILLDHAADSGVEVRQGTAVSAFRSTGDGCEVTLRDGTRISGGWFVDASGRRNSIITKQKRSWLSGYRNIAIWQHFVGGTPLQDLPEDWNVFHGPGFSPIGCFAFPDGWCWYIPVPKVVGGRRRITHSIGIVTIPAVLKEPGKDFTDQAVFLDAIRHVPVTRPTSSTRCSPPGWPSPRHRRAPPPCCCGRPRRTSWPNRTSGTCGTTTTRAGTGWRGPMRCPSTSGTTRSARTTRAASTGTTGARRRTSGCGSGRSTRC
jgi:hypothetical protein